MAQVQPDSRAATELRADLGTLNDIFRANLDRRLELFTTVFERGATAQGWPHRPIPR